MKLFFYKCLAIITLIYILSCKESSKKQIQDSPKVNNDIEYASGFSINKYNHYSVVRVNNPWPDAQKDFVYVLQQKNAVIPDSLQQYTAINVPLQNIVVTSTTNIPFLELLHVEDKLIGFPSTNYISSVKTRKRIDQGFVHNVGQNEGLNIEKLIDINPQLIVAFGVDNNNVSIDKLEKNGLKVLIQGDWMEQSPLGKAEWIKLYGALLGKEKEAAYIFNQIVLNYKTSLNIVLNSKPKATVMYGSMYQDQWYVAKGNSWVAQFLKDAKANYLWQAQLGTGSLSLSFEKVLEKAKNAQYWIATGSFKSLEELSKSNTHYTQFDAFKNKKVYSFESLTGATGGTIFYELSPSRPDLVLKDYIKIFHPELLPNYSLTFARQLK